MAVYDCPDCGGKVSDSAAACPHCGSLKRPPPPSAPTGEESESLDEKGGRSFGASILIIAVVLAGLYAIGTRDNGSGTSPSATSSSYTPTTRSLVVSYSVSGTATRASLTLTNDSGGTEQHDVALPWSRNYYSFDAGDFVYVSAQNAGDTGNLSCKITANGQTAYTGTASGGYSICSASGSIRP